MHHQWKKTIRKIPAPPMTVDQVSDQNPFSLFFHMFGIMEIPPGNKSKLQTGGYFYWFSVWRMERIIDCWNQMESLVKDGLSLLVKVTSKSRNWLPEALRLVE